MKPVIGLITNPYAGKNRPRGGKKQFLEGLLGRFGVVKETRNLEQLKVALEELHESGIKYLVCDGGDGTVHWAINTYYEIFRDLGADDFAREIPVIVPTNGGTIDFLAEKARVIGGTESILRVVTRRLEQEDEIPEVSLKSFHFDAVQKDQPFRKLGFSAAIAGASQRFFEKYYQSNNPSARTILEVIAKASASYVSQNSPVANLLPRGLRDYSSNIFEPQQCRVVIDGKEVPFHEFTTINAGSISINLKGVVRLFALADKGEHLHVQAGHLQPMEIIGNIPNLYLGRSYSGKEIVETTAVQMDVYAEGAKLLNPVIDGEMFEGISECHLKPGPHVTMISLDALAEQ